MTSPLARRTLRLHPRTPCVAVEEVSVEVDLEPGHTLRVRWRISGDLDRLRIPDPGAPLDAERLWAHTCCELFVAAGPGEAYVEWNFSPTGQIARFEFSAYRQRIPSGPSDRATSIAAVEPGALRLEARAPLPPAISESARIGLTAVIEDATGALSYWALHHPSDRPDFHHPGGFALALPLRPPASS